jgi:hypothetical protein
MSNNEVYSVSNRLMAAGVDGMVEWVTVRNSTMQKLLGPPTP